MWGNCPCGAPLKSSADILLRKCRRCQVAIIGEIRAPVFKQKPMRLNKLTKAMLELNS